MQCADTSCWLGKGLLTPVRVTNLTQNLSHQQWRLWYVEKLRGDSGVNESLHGALKAKRRSSFHKLNGPFKQWVHGKLLEMATLVLTDSRI